MLAAVRAVEIDAGAIRAALTGEKEAQEGEPRPAYGWMIGGGLVGGALGMVGGAAIAGSGDLGAGILGASLGATAGAPLGVHLGNRGRGEVGWTMLAGIGAGAGVTILGLKRNTHYLGILTGGPVAALLAAVLLESVTTH